MALPGENTKFYETPNHPYQGERIAEESDLVSRYGLKNKEEFWRAQSKLRNFRREARRLLGETGEVSGEEFVSRLQRIGILSNEESLDDVLSLDVTDVLERRLQTVVYRDGLANTVGRPASSSTTATSRSTALASPHRRTRCRSTRRPPSSSTSAVTSPTNCTPARAGAQE